MRLRQWPSTAASVTAHRQNPQTLRVLCDSQHQQLHLETGWRGSARHTAPG